MKKTTIILGLLLLVSCSASKVSESEFVIEAEQNVRENHSYVLNTSSMKFHLTDCFSAEKLLDENREVVFSSRIEIIDLGYLACGNCKP